MALGKRQLVVLVIGVMVSNFLLVGCKEEKSETEILKERVATLREELAVNQQRLGEAHRQVGLLNDQQQRAEKLEYRLSQAQSELDEVRDRSESAARFIQEKQTLLQLRDRLERENDKYRQQNNELVSEIDLLEQKLFQADQDANALRDQLIASEETIHLLEMELEEIKSDRDLEKLAEIVEQQRQQIDKAKNRIDQLEDEHPQFMLSILENRDKISSDDLGSWGIINLELTSSRFAIGQALKLTLPLPMVDHRGEFKLVFGMLEAKAASISVDVSSNTAAVMFENAAQLRAAMQISETDQVSVLFGPDDQRSELVFRIGEPETGLTGTTISFEPIEILLSGLKVVVRNSEGEWMLAGDE